VPSQVVDFTIVRGGKRVVLPVRLGERPKQPTPQC
jgi:S1-C subfamily serine protease